MPNVRFRPIADIQWRQVGFEAMRDPVHLFLAFWLTGMLVWLALIVLIVGLILLVLGAAGPLVVTGGVALGVVGLAGRYAVRRKLGPYMQQMRQDAEKSETSISMPLLSEGVDVWRQVRAIKIGDTGYMVTEPMPDDEQWAFEPGRLLECRVRTFSDGTEQLVPVGKVN